MLFSVFRLFQVDPIGLVPLVKKICRLDKCEQELARCRHIAAEGGDVAATSTFDRPRHLA